MRALRKARFGQIALVVASLLAVTGSLGLHPEPATVPVLAEPDGLAVWHGPQATDAAAHDCLACLAHRSFALARLSGVVLEPGAVLVPLFAPRAGRPSPAASRTHEGRAPPALA